MESIRPGAYGLLALGGILLTAWLWSRATGAGGGHDRRLTLVYFGGLVGALLGAKLAFLLAEGWHHRADALALLTGRSITGGLLGGYVAVELVKRVVRYPRTTGDVFAIIVPVALVLGRIGCLLTGCCPGRVGPPAWWTITGADGAARWPAAPAELVFNLAMLGWALLVTRRGWLPGNRFHVYLVAYGLFRFGHEFLRDDPPLAGPLTGYHGLALAIAALGAWRWHRRAAEARLTAGEHPSTVWGTRPLMRSSG
ncbi:MAG: prolipoprotein diacylglyceryl transferase [Planctomycetota bacterium]|jgi:phosphatidylglycerol:prolipoprotein diacylglycerol transferase